MTTRDAYITGFVQRCTNCGFDQATLYKVASTALARRILTLGEPALNRLGGLAGDTGLNTIRQTGKTPIWIGGPGTSLFGVSPRMSTAVQPSVEQHLVQVIRGALRRVRGDVLATRKPGRIKRMADRFPYW